LKLMRAAVTGKHSVALMAMMDGANPGAVLTPAVGEELMQLGRNGVDFVAAPVLQVAMTGNTLQHAEVAHFLISKGADPSLYSAEVQTNVDFAPGIMYTVGYQVFPNSTRAALLQKLVTGFPLKFDMQRVRTWALSTGRALPLQCAVEAGFYDGVYVLATLHMLVPRFVFDVNERDSRGRTAVMLASVTGQIEILQLLIHNNAKITLYDKDKRTVLHHAAISGHIGVIQTILNARKEVEILRKLTQLKDKDGRTPLGLASMTPVRMPVVRALRAMMTPLGVVPHTAPWLTKPAIHDSYKRRNISSYVAQYSERVASRLGSTEHVTIWVAAMEKLSVALNSSFESSVDCMDISGPWTDEMQRKIYRDYVSPKRPFLASTVSISAADAAASEWLFVDTDNILTSLGDWPQQKESGHWMSINSLACTTKRHDSSGECTLAAATEGEFKEIFATMRSDKLNDVGSVNVDADGDVSVEELTPRNIDGLNFVVQPFENIYMLKSKWRGNAHSLTEVVSDDMYQLFAGDWCDQISTHHNNDGTVSVGNVGGAMNGSVPLYAHYHNKLLSGAKLWYLFPAAENITQRTDLLEKALKRLATGFNPRKFIGETMPKLKELVDVHSVVQYRGDIIYIPTGYSFLSVNLLPAVSVAWQTCMLDLATPNCEAHGVITPVSE
jgi:ankyrin repeat protein